MNRTFKVVFSKVLGKHVVVSEIASNIQRGVCKAVAVLLTAGVLALPQAVFAGSPYLAPDQSNVTNDSGLDVYTVPGTTHQYTGDNAGIDIQLTQNAANGANVVVAGVSNMGTYTEGGKILLYQVESGSTGLGSVYYGEIETVEGIYKYTAVEKNGILYTNLAKARAAGVDVDSLTAQGYKVGVVKPTGGTISTAIQSASKPTSVTFGVRTQKTDTGYFQTQTITKKVSGTMNATAEKDVTTETVVQTGDMVTVSKSEDGNDLTISVNGEETTFSPVHYYSVNDGGSQQGNYNNTGATGLDSLAAGVGASATGIISSVTGAYSSVSGGTLQNLGGVGATVYGAVNTVEVSGQFDGVANSVIGIANSTSNANGALIWGAGNSITNALGTVKDSQAIMTAYGKYQLQPTAENLKALQTTLADAVAESGGNVMAVGGANKAGTEGKVSYSQLMGVSNELKSGNYNFLDGYKNTVEGDNNIAIGTENTVTGDKSIAIGYGHTVEGDGNAVIGDPNTVTGSDNMVLADNSTVTGNRNTAIGNEVAVEAN
ncbi:MAG: hypothetical protein KIG68_03655, partial [Oxalobacter sp.]|nr:hypothetical protein [Oxalobacter sp.]